MRWERTDYSIWKLFDGDEYLGKLSITMVGGSVAQAVFVHASDHTRNVIPLGDLVVAGAKTLIERLFTGDTNGPDRESECDIRRQQG